MSKNELKRRSGEGSGNGILFKDIDVLTKALYEDKTHPRSIINSTASSRSKAIVKPHLPETKSKSKINNEDRFLKDKKSIWSWNTFKSFTHVRNKRFNCCFSLQVHSIEGLPPSFDNLTLCVKWKRRDGELTTHPASVSQGVAEFEELLTNTCSVYGSRSGPHHSAKYEAKHFLLYASVYGDPELDLGKHRVDLTRLLPLTLEELEDEKSSGKWSTTYRLSGKAKGASMNVSFGYSVVDNVKSPVQSQMKRGESLPVMSRSYNRSVEDIKDLHEVFPVSKSELSESVSMLYKKLDEDKSTISVDYETKRDVQDFDTPDPEKSEFSILEQGIEFSVKEKATPEHDIKAYEEEEGTLKDQRFDEKELIMQELELAFSNVNEVSDSQEESENLKEDEEEGTLKDQSFDEKELIMQELELALNNVNEDSDSQEESENPKEDEEGLKGTETESVAGFEYEENENMEVKIGYKEKGKALKLDHATEVVAEDFLNMLGIDHSPFSLTSESESNSPRERLLRQFEKDALTNGSSLFNFNLDDDDDEIGFICDSSSTSMLPEEHNKTKASIMEDMESEALMREWGLNEKVFESSTKSQVDFSPEEPLELPPLGDNLGPFVETSNGGFLRSMSPEIFKNGKNGGNLIMQVSSPVVVPAEMGSGVMDVLQGLASVGIEKLSFQANKLMPLEDISGKTIQQIALEQESSSSIVGKSQSQRSRKYDLGDTDPEYVSLEDLAPLAMNKIEALSMEGLRIQSGMSDNEAPSNVSPKSIGEVSALEGKRVNLGTGGLQLLDVKNNGGNNGHDDNDDDGMDGMMGLSVSLDEWMRLDSGEIDESERTSRILTAHHASDMARVKRGGKNKKGGLLGNNFTVALMVQLRDPLRNFEPVGTPMLALVQVERVFVPPKPKIHSSIYWRKPEEEEEVKVKDVEEDNKVVVVEEESVLVPQFKVVEVHVAGVKSESESGSGNEGGKKGIWGWGSNAKQEKAGSRWLVANGMGKKNGKHPLMKSKAADKSSGGGGGGSLWSVSSKGKGKGKVDPPVTVRNPNVIIPNETVRLLSGAGFL